MTPSSTSKTCNAPSRSVASPFPSRHPSATTYPKTNAPGLKTKTTMKDPNAQPRQTPTEYPLGNSARAKTIRTSSPASTLTRDPSLRVSHVALVGISKGYASPIATYAPPMSNLPVNQRPAWTHIAAPAVTMPHEIAKIKGRCLAVACPSRHPASPLPTTTTYPLSFIAMITMTLILKMTTMKNHLPLGDLQEHTTTARHSRQQGHPLHNPPQRVVTPNPNHLHDNRSSSLQTSQHSLLKLL